MMNNYDSMGSWQRSRLIKGVGNNCGSPPLSRSRSSWLVMLLFFLSMAVGHRTWAQSTANYTYSTSTTGSLALDKDGNAIDMSTGTTQLYGAGVDTYTNPGAQNFGFTFRFMGSPYTQWNANPDGQIRLGTTLLSGHTSSAAAGVPLIIASNIDAITDATNGKVHYKVQTGTGGQVLIVEWRNIKLNWNATGTNLSTFQTRIYENGVIEFVYGAMFNSSTSAQSQSIGFSSGAVAGAVACISTINATPANTTNGTSYVTTSFTASSAMTNLNSAADGSRRVFRWTPLNVTPAEATSLSFTAVAPSTMTVNWIDNSTTESFYTVTRATDAAFTQNVVTSVVSSTTTAGTGTAYTSPQTGLVPSTTYYYRVVSSNEAGVPSTGITGSQATTAAATYYWVGATGGTWNLATNWNTAADGTGSSRGTVATTDILIVDGAGTTPGGTLSISVDLASFTIGQFKVTSNTNLTLASSATTTRTITLGGSPGDDFVIESGSSLIVNNATQAVAFAFTGTGNTGLIAGTYTIGGSTSNLFTTTGGTNTLVTVTGIVNLTVAGTTTQFVGSAATLSFASGSACNVTGGTTTGLPGLPLATWDANSTLTINSTALTTGTTVPNNANQSFGNFVYNCPNSSATISWFTTNTQTIKGNFTITSAGTGLFRAVTSGTLTINGSASVAGNLDIASGAGTFRVLGNFTQTAGTLSQSGTTGLLDFAGTSAQSLTLLNGAHGTNAINVRLNNAAGLNLVNDMSIRNLTVTNGNISGAGNLVYATSSVLTYNATAGSQTITSKEFPATSGPGSLTINNTATAPNNVVTMAFGRTLPATGVLTLTAGILDGGSNVLYVQNPSPTAAIVGGSATAFVRGIVARDLTSGQSGTSTYLFPVGKTAYAPLSLVDPTTNAGVPVTVQAEVVETATGGSAGSLIGSLNTDRYWAASITAGSANFTGTRLRLDNGSTALGTANAIAASATLTGAYDLQGGTSPTVAGNIVTSQAPVLTVLPGYFVLATKASPPVLTALAVSPTGNQCTNVARTVTVTVTPGASPISSVVINYSVNGTAQTAITMSNTTGNDWSGTIPTVSPVNGTVAWTVVATDTNNITASLAGTSYTDEPNLGFSANTTSTSTNLCNGQSTTLNFNFAKPSTTIDIGTATTTTALTAQPTAFCNRWPSYRMQLLYTAAELSALGFSSGNISSMAFNIISSGSAATNANFTVSMSGTTSTSFTTTSWLTGNGTVVVFPAQTYTHTASGWQTINFATPYFWDGTSNILVDISMDGADSTNNSETLFTSSASNMVLHSNSSGKLVATGTQSTNRLNVRFGVTSIVTPTNISWSNGSTVVGNTQSLSVTPTATTNYTVTFTVNGCNITSNPLTVTVNPIPTAPTATNSTQCGAGIPTASVVDPNGFSSPNFKWYADNVTTTALQTSTSATYTTSISTTTTFYVAVVNPTTGCESTRTPVTVTVTTAAPITVTPGTTATVCQNGTLALGASSSAAYNYTWTASPATGSGITGTLSGSSVNVIPTGTGTYVYTVTGTDGLCTTTATVTVTITPAPILTITTPAPVCPGTPVTLTALTSTIGTGAVKVGNGTSVSSSTSYPTAFGDYWYQDWQQYVFTAAELNAAGLTAGNITSIAFNVSSLPSANVSNYNVRIGTTSNSTLSTFVTTGLTNVYGPALYSASVGLNTITFSTPYNWNGTSNIIIDIRGTGTYGSANATVEYTTTPDNKVVYAYTSSNNSNFWTSSPTATTTTSRPNITFTGNKVNNSVGSTVYTWNDASNTSGNVLTVSPLTTTTYQVAGYDSTTGCTGYQSVTVTVTPVPSAPTATNSTQCGSGVPTASVADTNGFAAPIYKWYADNVTTTALQSGSSATYTTSISATTTFYVSVTSATSGCESLRTPVTITVNTPATIQAVASVSTICAGETTTLTASALTGTVSSYTWTPATGLSTANGASVTATPSTTTTYSVTGVDSNGCTTPAVTVTVVVKPLPSAITINQTPSSVCSGSVATLTANGGVVNYTSQLGTQSGTTSTDGITPFSSNWEGSREQYLIRASELTANGVLPGQLKSLGFVVTASGLGTYPQSNFAIKIAHTANTALTSAYGTPTGSFTTVYTAASEPAPAVGTKTFTFSTPFVWDGVSNILVDICHDNDPTATCTSCFSSNSTVATTTTAFNSVWGSYADNAQSCGVQAATTITTFTSRPLMIFGAQTTPAVVWSPTTNLYTDVAATLAYTGDARATVYAKLTSSATYTVTSNPNGCPVSTNVTVTPLSLPSFTTSNITICKGTSGTLSATSAGSNSYSWTPVGGGATLSGASVSVNPLVTTTYNVTATDNVTSCQSTSQVTVTVNDPGTITSQPINAVVSPGQPATFSVTATGSPLTYQWQVDDNINGWVNISDDYVDATTGNYSGTNTSTLTIQNITLDFDNYQYRCLVTGAAPCVSLPSDAATLTVTNTGFVEQPANVTLCGSGTAQFDIVTSGDEPYSVQWLISTNNGASYTEVIDGFDALTGLTFADATTKVLSVSGITTANNNYKFKCQLDFFLDSNVATLTVNGPVVVSTNPTNQTVCYSGGTSTFGAVATGSFTSVQWQYSANGSSWASVTNGTPLGATYTGASTGTLTVTTTAATPVAGTYYYRAYYTAQTPCTDVASQSAQLIINNPTITTQPVSASVGAGYSATFNAVANATGIVTYQWQYATSANGTYANVTNNTPTGITYSGATTNTLTVNADPSIAASTANYYRLVVVSDGCSVNTTPAQLTVNSYCLPVPTTQTGTTATDTILNVTLTNVTTSDVFTQATNSTLPWVTVYPDPVLDVVQGQSMSVNMVFGSDGTQYSAVWVDFNHNGLFEASENVGLATSPAGGGGTVTYNFTLPINALTGSTRIRLRGGSDTVHTAAGACAVTSYGETQDYYINVLAAPACSGSPIAGTLTSSVSNVCYSGSATLTLNGYTSTVTGITLQWYNSAGAISGANSATYTTPVISSPETYYVRVTCSNTGGFTDSNSVTIGVYSPSIVSTTPAARCGTGTVSLAASASAGSTINWYSAATGGVPLATGSSFTTPSINTTTTFYAEAVTGSLTTNGARPAPAGTSSTTPSTYGLVFDATSAFTLNSVQVYPNGSAGNVTIQLQNSAGTALQTLSAYSLPAGSGTTAVTVPLGWSITPGTGYRLVATAGTSSLVRESSLGGFPYALGSVGSITNGYILGTSTTYYYFYNWSITVGCQSPRQAVVATVNTPPALTLNGATSSICNGGSTALVSVTSVLANYDNYVWSPATGVSGSAAAGYTFNPTATTTYTLTATNSVSGCANTANYTVTVNPVPNVSVTSTSSTICANGAATVTLNSFSNVNPAPTGGCTTSPNGLYPTATYTALTCNGTTQNVITTAAYAGEYSNVNIVSGSRYVFSSSISTDYLTITNSDGSIIYAAGLTPVSYYSGANEVIRFYTHTNSSCGTASVSRTRQFTCQTATGISAATVWSPTAGLYTNAAGTIAYTGTAVATVYALPTATTTYTATQTTGAGCVGSGTTTITVNPVSVAGTATALATTVCSGTGTSITLNGYTGTIQWQSSSNGSTGWIAIAGATNATLNTGNLTSSLYYRALVTSGVCSSVISNSVLISVDPISVGGTASTAASIICSGTSTTLTLSGNTGLVQWQSSSNGVSGWSNVSGANSASLNTGILTATTYYRALVTSGVCSSATSNVVTVTVNTNVTYYADADGDGFGNASLTSISCSGAPVGYVSNNLDCDDTKSNVNPSAVDVCYDGIDNDCNGNIDNLGLPGGCTPIVSSIPTASCGTTVQYGSAVYSSLVTGAQGYRYRVTRVNPADDSAMGAPVIVDMNLRNLYLSNLSNYAYNAKYKVEIAVKYNNVWQPNYSAPCYLFTPTPVSTMISCGTQVVSLTTQVTSTSVVLATGYKYLVQRMNGASVVSSQEIVSGIRNFSFSQVTDLRYDAFYSVSCAVRNTDGTYLPYGPTCTFQAPKHPTTQVRATQCNDYAVASFSEYIYADLVRDVQAYRFRLFNESQQYDFSVDKSGNNFRLSDFPGLVGGETYSVQVAVRMSGQQDFGNYGKTCTLIIPTIARSMEDTTVGAITFDAQVYPNPFAEQFYFKVASASAADYTIQVYDMLGKLVENRTVSSDSIESTEVGANFPAGVYNVILTQGENIKTLRVVKR